MTAVRNSLLNLSLMEVTEETLALDEQKLLQRHVVIINTSVGLNHLNLK